MLRNGSASVAYDLPPPAAPPYRTSRSLEARYCVCGPGLGLKTMFCTSSTSYSGGLTVAGFAAFVGVVVFVVVGVGSCVVFFERFDLL